MRNGYQGLSTDGPTGLCSWKMELLGASLNELDTTTGSPSRIHSCTNSP